MAKGGE